MLDSGCWGEEKASVKNVVSFTAKIAEVSQWKEQFEFSERRARSSKLQYQRVDLEQYYLNTSNRMV